MECPRTTTSLKTDMPFEVTYEDVKDYQAHLVSKVSSPARSDPTSVRSPGLAGSHAHSMARRQRSFSSSGRRLISGLRCAGTLSPQAPQPLTGPCSRQALPVTPALRPTRRRRRSPSLTSPTSITLNRRGPARRRCPTSTSRSCLAPRRLSPRPRSTLRSGARGLPTRSSRSLL